MVATNNPFDELERKLENGKRNMLRINEIVGQGFISERFGEYAKYLIVLNHLSDQVEAFAIYGYQYSAQRSLSNAESSKNTAICLYTQSYLEKFKEIPEHYKELVNLAGARYDEAVNQFLKIKS